VRIASASCFCKLDVLCQLTDSVGAVKECVCYLQDTFDTQVCMSQSQKYTIDFMTANESDLHDIIIPLSFDIQQTGHVHGLAFWFEVAFIGSQFVCFWFSACF